MDRLWSPWRYRYISEGGSKGEGCVFCEIGRALADDEANFVVYRGEANFVVLNRYPYTSGHVMTIPYEHYSTLEEAPIATLEEMMRLTRRLEAILRGEYGAEGVNIGMNIGKAAGAGVAGHIHMHALPRWEADSNFMTTVGETRVLPEELPDTWRRIRKAMRLPDSTAE